MNFLVIIFSLFTTALPYNMPKYIINDDHLIILHKNDYTAIQEIAQVNLTNGSVKKINPHYNIESTLIVNKYSFRVFVKLENKGETHLYLSKKRHFE